jgi:hypothetical protein
MLAMGFPYADSASIAHSASVGILSGWGVKKFFVFVGELRAEWSVDWGDQHKICACDPARYHLEPV